MATGRKEDRIREEAYRLWQAEGWPAGQAESHWLQAERKIAERDKLAGVNPEEENSTEDSSANELHEQEVRKRSSRDAKASRRA